MSWPPAPPALRDQTAPRLGPSVSQRSRLDRVVGYALFAVLLGMLGLAAAVLITPRLIDDLRPALPFLTIAGSLSTLGAVWWLWRRPR